MPVLLKVFNVDNSAMDMEEGIDLGLSRKGKDNISSFLLKNEGNTLARDVIVVGSPLHDLKDVEDGIISEEDYQKEVIASQWKTFSLDPNGEFVKELNLGRIYAGLYVQGTQLTEISTQSEGLFPYNAVHSNAEFVFKDNVFSYQKANLTPNGYSSLRMQHEDPNKRKTRHFELTFKPEFIFDDKVELDTTPPYISIPVRNNLKGDNKGYGFLMTYNRSNNSVTVSVRTDMIGILSHYDGLQGGTAMYQTRAITLDGTREFTLKVYDDTDENRTPCFEVLYGGERQKLYALVGDASGFVMKDTSSKAYKGSGNYYIECAMQEGDVAIKFSNMSIVTDLERQPIYVKTTVDDRAENRVEYRSSIAISYYED